MAFLDSWSPRLLSVLRIVSAYIFMLHGTAKLLGFPHMANFDNLQIMSLGGIGGILELVGGALLLLGLFTRPVAFILSGEMAVAYFISHASKGGALFPVLKCSFKTRRSCSFSLITSSPRVAPAASWFLSALRRE